MSAADLITGSYVEDFVAEVVLNETCIISDWYGGSSSCYLVTYGETCKPRLRDCELLAI